MLSEKRKFLAIPKEFEHIGYPPSLCRLCKRKKPYGGCRMAFFGWDSWTQNRGFRLYTADALVHLRENLIRCEASEWFFVIVANDKKGERGCVLPFYGWDSWTRTSDAGVKVLCLDRLGDIPSLRAIIPYPPPPCQVRRVDFPFLDRRRNV